MKFEESRQNRIEISAGDGNIDELKSLLEHGYTQLEIDTALANAIAYSQIKIAEYLLSLGAVFSNYDYQGILYAASNNELEGLKFAISKGIDININNGMLINESVETSINTKNIVLFKWLIDNGADINLLTKQSIELINKYGSEDLKALAII